MLSTVVTNRLMKRRHQEVFKTRNPTEPSAPREDILPMLNPRLVCCAVAVGWVALYMTKKDLLVLSGILEYPDRTTSIIQFKGSNSGWFVTSNL